MNSPSRIRSSNQVLTVSELNIHTRQLLEANIPLLWIKGEISNLKCYQSGHWYFSLKDTNAQVRCVIFSHKNQYIDWEPRDGMQVEVLALVTLYEPRGEFQLNVEIMRQAGLGERFEALEQLKIKLAKAGLFNPEQKKPLPIFPKQIGIITSPDTAALHDILITLQRRMPSIPIIIYPTLVQGKTAANHIADAIKVANRHSECDVLLICRGGGSIEDLWAFNEEIVAQAIAASTIPIVSGIGHETDFTIADLVADQRAATPTAAASIVSPDRKILHQQVNDAHQRLLRVTRNRIERIMQQLDLLSYRLIYPGDRIKQQAIQLASKQMQLRKTWQHQWEKMRWKLLDGQQRLTNASPDLNSIEQRQHQFIRCLHQSNSHHLATLELRLKHLQTQLTQLNPHSILKRGYSISYTQQGEIVSDSKQLQYHDRIRIKFARGACEAIVDNTTDS